MSTESGDKAVVKAAMDVALDLVAEAAAEEQQLDLLEPLTADEIQDAQEALGPLAGMVTVMREARKRRAGRPKGVRNKRTNDLERLLAQHGPNPAIGLMQIASSTPEELVARSRLIDPPKRQLSYGDALDRIIRCREALMPYLNSKKPVAVDATIRGVMVVEEIGSGRPAGVTIDADEPLGVLRVEGEEG